MGSRADTLLPTMGATSRDTARQSQHLGMGCWGDLPHSSLGIQALSGAACHLLPPPPWVLTPT